MTNKEGPVLQDSLIDEDIDNDYDSFEKSSLSMKISNYLIELQPLEERIIRLRYGLTTLGSFNLKEVASMLKVDSNKIKRIESSRLKKLKMKFSINS